MHDLLTVIKFVQTAEYETQRIHLVGLGPIAGPLVAAARAQAGDAVATAAVDTGGFRFASLDRLDGPMFVPGAAKYGDVALSAAHARPRRPARRGGVAGERRG